MKTFIGWTLTPTTTLASVMQDLDMQEGFDVGLEMSGAPRPASVELVGLYSAPNGFAYPRLLKVAKICA